jgi:hemolysin activation/secretion protein
MAGASITFNLRGLSSSAAEFDDKRYLALGSFVYYRADLSRVQELPWKFQLSARVNGQYTADPLIGPEQLTAGGAESVRGYLESQVAGDVGAVGSLELRSPSILKRRNISEWRILVFTDGGWVGIHKALVEQQKEFMPWSAGAGMRLELYGRGHLSFDVGVPLRTEPGGKTEGKSRRFEPRVHLRALAEF